MPNTGKHPPILAILTAVLLISGPALAQNADQDGAPQVIAVVNGEQLSQADFVSFVKSRLGDQSRRVKLNQQQLGFLLTEYINRELIYQNAVAQGLDEQPEVATALANQRRNIVASYAVRQLVDRPISDEELQAAYDRMMARPVREYRASHILLDSEQRAREVIHSLEQGATFEKMARENSMDATAEQGGELGWLSTDQMSEPLRDAMHDMKKGTFTKSPVKTDFGWHVLHLEDTRIIPPPPFEDVKDELVKRLHNRHVSEYIAKLRQNSEIEIK